MLTTAAMCRPGRQCRVPATGHPGREIDVMGRQIEDDPHVADPGWEGTLATRDHLVDLAQLPVLDAVSSLLQGRVVPLDVSDRADEATLLEGGVQCCRLRRIQGERLLDERVNARLRKLQSKWQVGHGGRCDHAVVGALLQQLLDGGIDGPTLGSWVGAGRGIGDPDEVDPGRPASTRAWLTPIEPRPIRPARSISGTRFRHLVDSLRDRLPILRG